VGVVEGECVGTGGCPARSARQGVKAGGGRRRCIARKAKKIVGETARGGGGRRRATGGAKKLPAKTGARKRPAAAPLALLRRSNDAQEASGAVPRKRWCMEAQAGGAKERLQSAKKRAWAHRVGRRTGRRVAKIRAYRRFFSVWRHRAACRGQGEAARLQTGSPSRGPTAWTP